MKKKYIIGAVVFIIIIGILLIISISHKNNSSEYTINQNQSVDENMIGIVQNTPQSEATKDYNTTNYTFTQIITHSDENSTLRITKNKLSKTAIIELSFNFDENQLITDFIDAREFTTVASCRLIQMKFFDENAMNEFENEMDSWNNSEYVIKDDSPPEEQDTSIINTLDGYTVTRTEMKINLKSGTKVAECVATGKDENQLSIIRYYEPPTTE